MDEEFYINGPILDKNGNELRIGDTVHYKRDASEYEINGRTHRRPARDVKFVIDGFKKSPFVENRHHARGFEDPIWVTGEGFNTPNFRTGRVDSTRNAVSPKALVKINSPLVKKTKMDLTFVKPSKRLHVTESSKLTIFEKIRQLFG